MDMASSVLKLQCIMLSLILIISCMIDHIKGAAPSTSTAAPNTTISDGGVDESDDDPLAANVSWISAVSGCVILFSMAAVYATYVLCRQRRERRVSRDQDFALLMSSTAGRSQITQIDDFK